MYHQYQARKAERDTIAKQARGDADNDEAWNGLKIMMMLSLEKIRNGI